MYCFTQQPISNSQIQLLKSARSSVQEVEIRSLLGALERSSNIVTRSSCSWGGGGGGGGVRLHCVLFQSHQSPCLFPEWTWGRSLSTRSPCRWPHMRPNNPGRCAAVWKVTVKCKTANVSTTHASRSLLLQELPHHRIWAVLLQRRRESHIPHGQIHNFVQHFGTEITFVSWFR